LPVQLTQCCEKSIVKNKEKMNEQFIRKNWPYWNYAERKRITNAYGRLYHWLEDPNNITQYRSIPESFDIYRKRLLDAASIRKETERFFEDEDNGHYWKIINDIRDSKRPMDDPNWSIQDVWNENAAYAEWWENEGKFNEGPYLHFSNRVENAHNPLKWWSYALQFFE
jgi:hypothetical protein